MGKNKPHRRQPSSYAYTPSSVKFATVWLREKSISMEKTDAFDQQYQRLKQEFDIDANATIHLLYKGSVLGPKATPASIKYKDGEKVIIYAEQRASTEPATVPASTQFTDSCIQQLRELGFSDSWARKALGVSNGVLEAAIDWALNNPEPSPAASPAPVAKPQQKKLTLDDLIKAGKAVNQDKASVLQLLEIVNGDIDEAMKLLT